MSVYVLDKHKKPLMPCSEKRARLLLERGRARVHRLVPFTIRLIDRLQEDSVFQPIEIKIDPGSKVTGVAVVRISESFDSQTGEVVKTVNVLNLIEITHRGQQIKDSLTKRRNKRRRYRSTLRYRQPRFNNRGNKHKGWIAPSLQHRVDTTEAWIKKLQGLLPVTSLAMELVKFDMQKIRNPDIQGKEYQQGTLLGYEVREYLLEKWNRTCAYCGGKNVPLQMEHIVAKANSGTNNITNLTLACKKCNTAKGILPIEVFLAKKPNVLKKILSQAKRPLIDAAAVNTTRWTLFNALKTTGLPLSTGTGGQTKFNRTLLNIPKAHALDAACVGVITDIADWQKPTLQVKCMGRGSYQRTLFNKYGFPRGYLMREKMLHNIQTGDIVLANVTSGKKIGVYQGRVAVRKTGNFDITTPNGLVSGVSHRFCTVLQRGDGYKYQQVAKMDALGTLPKPIDAVHQRSTSPA